MRRDPIIKCGLAALLLITGAHVANADQPTTQEYDAQLSGFLEIGPLATPTGAILTNGSGKLTLVVQGNTAQYSLTYSGLTSNVTQSHIHFGQKHNAGGIFVFLCTNLNNGPAGVVTPSCPQPTTQGSSVTVNGTITAANILAVPAQNIPAANFDVLLAALTSDTAYVNVHTMMFPGGEIRGQVAVPEKDDHGKDKDNGKGNSQ
jgi:hypothetical protein